MMLHRYSDDSVEHRTKARRRETDDDHSSSDVHSISRMSMISFATVDSDPGPRPSRRVPPANGGPPPAFGINRTTSVSSLRSSDFSSSARSSNSLEGQFITDFTERASFYDPSNLSGSPIMSMTSTAMDPGGLSPPPMQSLSLSPASHQWQGSDGSSPNSPSSSSMQQRYAGGSAGLPTMMQPRHPGPVSPYEYSSFSQSASSSTGHGNHSPSPGPPSAINPMFQVVHCS
jgi:meiosis induction protein kinase IME2/SME1